MVSAAIKKRQRHNLFLIDIAAPRDIEDGVGDLYNTFLFTIDDLKQVVEENKEKRQEEADRALAIIDEEVVGLENWVRSLDVIPLISEIKKKADLMLEDELSRARHTMGDEEFRKLEEHCRNLVGRIIHQPITGLKSLGESGQGQRAGFYARKFFGLDDPAPRD
jgi:glutamyl-tRNA reductase